MRQLRAGRVIGTLVVPLVLCVTVPGPSAGNPPSSAAVPVPPSGFESVVVTLREGATALPRARAPDRTLRPGVVKQRLRVRAQSSQRALLGRLADWRGQGRVTDVRSLWISNAVAVTATPDVIRQISARPDVASVQADIVEVTPTADPTANQVTVGAPAVWATGETGQGVVVATLDSGVDPTDPDLAARWRGGSNSWFDPYGQHATPYDATGHGTAVLGVMTGGDDTGAAVGTAPGARWIAARIFDDAGGATLSGLHTAFQWLLDPDGDPTTDDAPDVVNGSWVMGTGPSCNLSLQPDVQALRDAGILPVFAAGNFGGVASSSASPANYPEWFSFGAVSGTDLVRSDSSRGPSSCGGRTRVFPDLTAPGTAIATLDRGGLTQTASGTSVAAPHAAGALALLLAARPGLTPAEQAALLTGTAVDLGAAGPDDVYGVGRLDIAAAYAALPGAPPPPPAKLWFSTTGSVRVPGLGSPDDGDVYSWDGAGYGRTFDAAAAGLLAGADVDGLDVVGPGHFFASFDRTVRLPGLGWVQDEDVVEYDAGTWSVRFNGTAHGLRSAAADIDALTVRGGRVFFSTRGNARVRGVGGRPDKADVYRWDGTRFARVWRARSRGVPRGANVDGLVWVNPSRTFVTFADRSVRLPGLGRVSDEDLVLRRGGSWAMRFNGSAHGLGGADGLDLDAVDLP